MAKLRELWGLLCGGLRDGDGGDDGVVWVWEFEEHEREAMRKYFRWANSGSEYRFV